MSSRIVHRNRVIYQSPGTRRVKRNKGTPLNSDGKTDVKFAQAIPPNSRQAPYLAGVPVWDAVDRVYYRCVQHLDPLQGWASTEFWQARWNLDHKAILYFVEAGKLDAAVEAKSKVKLYRCRDEWTLMQGKFWERQQKRVRLKLRNARVIKAQSRLSSNSQARARAKKAADARDKNHRFR